MAIIMFSVSFYCFTLANAVHDKNSSEYILEGRNLNTQILKKYVDARIELTRLESALNIKIIFPTIFGCALLAMAIGGWKRHEHCKLVANELRTLIAINQRGEKASNESLKTDAAEDRRAP